MQHIFAVMMHPIRSLPAVLWYRYRDHLVRLDGDDRRLRFGRTLDAAAISRFVAGLDPAGSRVLVFSDPTLAVRGAVLISLLPGGGAELAFSIEAPWRRRGLGRDLAARALLWLRNRGIARAQVFCAGENLAMRRLARRAGFTLRLAGSECEGSVALAPASLRSLLREAVAAGAGLNDAYRRARWIMIMRAFRFEAASQPA